MNVSERYIENLGDCEYITTRNIMELVKDNGVRRILARAGIGKKEVRGRLYLKYLTDVRQRQVRFYEEDDIIFRADQENALQKAASSSMTRENI